MKAVSYRLFWNSETEHWTLVRDVADAHTCQTQFLAEHSTVSAHHKWLAPKEWAAGIIGCCPEDLRGVTDEYFGQPMTWHVTALLVTA